MIDSSFVQGWTAGPKRGLWDAVSGAAAPLQPVDLPHDWLRDQARSTDADAGSHSGYYPGGAVEYHKTIHVPQEHRDRTLIVEFDGVYRDAMVFVNDAPAAQRPNGYARFLVTLDPFLVYGADNRIRVEARAHQDSRWYTGIGIHRGAALHVKNRLHVPVDGVHITTPTIEDDHAVVAVATMVTNAGQHTVTANVRTHIDGPDGAEVGVAVSPVTLFPGDSAVVRQRIAVEHPERWSVDAPHLHRARTTLSDASGQVVDEETTTFGIRTLTLDARRGLRINGQPVDLRGACIHHDNGILGSRSFAQAEERRVRILKEAGFNAIRSSHHPLSTPLLEACDRLGMLVMDEAFDVWTEAKTPFDYSLAFGEWWERDIESMVARDFNHPSVIFYSIGNEIPETGTPAGSRLGRRIAEKVRTLDPTRFVTNDINGLASTLRELSQLGFGAPAAAEPAGGVNDMMSDMGEGMKAIDPLVSARIEESLSVLDAAGLNYGESRYLSDLGTHPDRVIIGTETYPGSIAQNWPLVTEHPHLIGDFTWTGWDYLGESGIGRTDYAIDGGGTSAPYPWLSAWCGDIDITGHRRPASYFREIVFGLRAEPYIAVRRPEHHGETFTAPPWAWSDSVSSWTWPVRPGAPVTVEVYSAADEVELLRNGESLGRRPSGPANGYTSVFDATYAPGELTAIALRDGQEYARWSVQTADRDDLAVRCRVDRERVSAGDLVFVEISLADAAGRIVTGDDRGIRLEITGPGTMLGFGSARPNPTDSYAQETQTTFDGRALAIVRASDAGTLSITASTTDASLPAGVVQLTVAPDITAPEQETP
ncbi:glycoside hydrolase family 2 TIM barrel-domain containing protein [Microbacterium pullorum]|uniref:glycoside hydrolase family 2 TIM barrel-domain containing protein n=1 Tax=Microbacterium pullorum TaxID=2762236 RepID=UPI00296AF51C|nr:glycoside hydrolase family 2 TIM barrel-domain containing protein [Microbacterium pullorum]